MTTSAPATTAQGPFLKGSILWQKKGPLPVWAWALIGLGVVLAISMWRRNSAASTATEAATGSDELPGDQTAPPVFVVPQAATPAVNVTVETPPATVPTAPPGGGRDAPPGVPKPPAIKREKVTVKPWTSKSPPWESTLSGIYAHFKGKTTATNWQAIWNHPLNADLKKKRGAADKIRPGDIVWVPVR